MLKRTLFFTTPYVLSLKNNQMIIKTREMPDMHNSIPIEDIGFVILEHQQTSITLPLLNALANNNVGVIICGDNYMPNAALLSLESNTTQGETLRLQMAASEPFKKNIWKQIVESKIKNQAALLNKLGKNGEILRPYYSNVKSGDIDNREGIAAKIYWNELFGNDFIRIREGAAPNNLLNYGYTILRAAVARALMGSGLLPAIGIFHRNKYNAFPLADDIMEPYRPYVDEVVYRLYSQEKKELLKEIKAEILKILFTDTQFGKTTHPLEIGLTTTTASLVKCLNGISKKILYPQLE